MSLAVAERMYAMWDYDTPEDLCQCEHLWHCVCVCVCALVCVYISMMNVCV